MSLDYAYCGDSLPLFLTAFDDELKNTTYIFVLWWRLEKKKMLVLKDFFDVTDFKLEFLFVSAFLCSTNMFYSETNNIITWLFYYY